MITVTCTAFEADDRPSFIIIGRICAETLIILLTLFAHLRVRGAECTGSEDEIVIGSSDVDSDVDSEGGGKTGDSTIH